MTLVRYDSPSLPMEMTLFVAAPPAAAAADEPIPLELAVDLTEYVSGATAKGGTRRPDLEGVRSARARKSERMESR